MAERRTSAAKDILTPREESLLETYGVARNHFEHARDPSISQQHADLAREQAAQEAREGRGSILEGNGDRLPEFNDRANDNGDDRSGSKMVQDDRPAPEMRPSEDIARPVDRDAFDSKWLEEQTRAREQNQDQDREPEREP